MANLLRFKEHFLIHCLAVHRLLIVHRVVRVSVSVMVKLRVVVRYMVSLFEGKNHFSQFGYSKLTNFSLPNKFSFSQSLLD